MKKYGKGSGRSILGFDLHNALMNCKDYLVGFGGHSMAIGLSVEKDNFEKFKEHFLNIVNKSNISNLVPILNIDGVLNIDEINKEMVESLSLLEPFGEANKINNNNYINAIGFNLGSLASDYKIGDRVDVAGNIEINSFNGVESIQINLKDIMKTV